VSRLGVVKCMKLILYVGAGIYRFCLSLVSGCRLEVSTAGWCVAYR
jgi:hypothetical protein